MKKNIKFIVSLSVNVILTVALLILSFHYSLFVKIERKVFGPFATISASVSPVKTSTPAPISSTILKTSESTPESTISSFAGTIIAFHGDSITNEMPWGKYFPDLQIFNDAVPGYKTADVYNSISLPIGRHPTKVFLMVGINDIGNGIPLNESVGNYENSLRELRDKLPGAIVYVQSILPCNISMRTDDSSKRTPEHIKALNQEIERLAQKYGAVYIDLYGNFADEYGMMKPEYTRDGIHLSETGCKHWADMLREYIYK